MNFKKITLMSSIKESFKSNKKRTSYGDFTIYKGKEGYEKISEALLKPNCNIVRLSHYQARLIFEFLREKKFSKKVYFPEDFRVNSVAGVLSENSLKHIAQESLKSLRTADVICLEMIAKEESLLIQSFPKSDVDFVVLDNDERSVMKNTTLLKSLEGKKVLVLSPYSELIKVQHLHQRLFNRDITSVEGSFDLCCLSLDQIFSENGAYTLFDKLDTLKIEILKYDFDLVLTNLSILSLQVNSFINSLGKAAIDLDEELLRVFAIAKDSAEKSRHDGYWVDLSSYNSGNEKTFLVTGVIGAPIKVKKGKRKK